MTSNKTGILSQLYLIVCDAKCSNAANDVIDLYADVNEPNKNVHGMVLEEHYIEWKITIGQPHTLFFQTTVCYFNLSPQRPMVCLV